MQLVGNREQVDVTRLHWGYPATLGYLAVMVTVIAVLLATC